MDSPQDPLERLVKAARKAPSRQADVPTPAEVGSLRERVRTALLTLTWRRISTFAAILAGIAFVIFYFMVREDEPDPAPANPPVPEFPDTP